MKNSIIRKILAVLLSITVPIFVFSPVFPMSTVSVASAASTPPTVTINNIPDYVNSLPTISGTTTDTTPSTIDKVQIQIINQSNTTFWDGSAWQSLFSKQTVDSEGSFISMTFDGSGNPAISYFDSTHKDIKFARWNGSSWIKQTVDSTSQVELVSSGTSLAFDGNGNPSISYRDNINSDIKFARWNGSNWVLQTVDSDGTMGRETSLAFDGSGNPAISYRDDTNRDLKFARWNGSSWVLQTVDSAGEVGEYTSLGFDGSGNPAISYYDYTNRDLKFARWTGSSWVLQTVDSAGGVGTFTSLAFNGNPAISYFDGTNGNVKFARWNGSSWVLQTVDSVGIFGGYTSLAFDSSGNPAISYSDDTNHDLRFARWNGSSWVLQTVDSDGGIYTSLAFDSSGNPAISYRNSTNGNINFARWNASWSNATGTTSWSYTMPSLTNGSSYKIVARIINNSGNILATTTEYFTCDITAPAVTLSSTSTSPTKTSPIAMTATFSEAVTGFIVGEITVSNGTAGNFVAVSNTVYTFNITPAAQGTVIVNIAAGVAQDAAFNSNTAATQFSITYDSIAPTVTLSSTITSPTKTSPIAMAATFSEAVTGFVVGEITVSNGTAGNFVAVSNTVYTFNITPAAQGTVIVNIAAGVAQDAAFNSNTAATQFSITYDSIAPAVTLSSTSTSPTKTSPIAMTVTFSEAVTSFVVGEITVGNGTAGNFVAVSNTVYTFDITPTAQGAITVNVAAGVAQDAALNNNTAATQFSITYDSTAPTISIIAVSNISAISVTITWTTNEASTSQVEYGNTTAYGSSTTLDTTRVTSHNVVLTGLTPGTTYHYRIKSKDSSNNEAVSVDNTFTTLADTTAPVITVVQSDSLTTTGATITWMTNEASTSQVEYGIAASYGSTITLDSTLITNHSINITGLTAGTIYHYRVKSKDISNNEGISDDSTFTTASKSGCGSTKTGDLVLLVGVIGSIVVVRKVRRSNT